VLSFSARPDQTASDNTRIEQSDATEQPQRDAVDTYPVVASDRRVGELMGEDRDQEHTRQHDLTQYAAVA
jgi:hypothetical protein